MTLLQFTYQHIKEIEKKNRAAKEKWTTDICEEMDELEKKYDSLKMYKKVREDK